jgi:hypothetical protein
MSEANWDQHVAMSTFRYNCSVISATGLTPYCTTFGVHAFEFDGGLGLELRLEEEPEDLPKALARIHQELLSAGHRSGGTAANYYDRAVKACSYSVGDPILLYYSTGEIEQGRKLRVPWLGPYRVVARHSSVAYTIRSELDDSEGTTHVNRLKKITEDSDLSDVRRPQYGMWPDVRRVLRGILVGGRRGPRAPSINSVAEGVMVSNGCQRRRFRIV